MGAVAFALGGCEIYPWFYPRFDNPINPDIRDIRSGDVVEGVKCAVTSYLWERAGLVLKNARAEIRAERKCYSPTSAQLAQGRGWIVKYQHYENKESSRDDPCPGGVPPGTHSDAAAQSHAAKKLKGTEEPPKPHRVGIASSDVPDEVHKLVDRLAKLPDKDAAAEIASIEADPWYKCLPHYLDSNGYCKPEAYLFEAKSSKACVSNGGCPPGTLRANNNICLISDSSRFAFDSHSNATIELQLTATNTGTVTYGKIDLAKLGPLTKIFYPAQLNANGTASSLVSAPIIPSAYVKGKASNIVTMQFDLPQSPYIPEAANPTAVKEELNRINNAIRSLARMLGPRQGFFAESVLSLVETPPAPKPLR